MFAKLAAIWHCVMTERGFGRMAQWGVLSIIIYLVVLYMPMTLTLQAALLKGANVNAGMFLGYWGDRTVFYRADDIIERKGEDGNAPAIIAGRMLARAVIMASCVIGISTGIGA